MGGYGKRPLWQWVVIYAVIGLVVYGAIYYFVLAPKGGYNFSPSSYTPPSTAPTTESQGTPSATAAKNAVRIANFKFSPAALTVKAGDSVTWTNSDSAGHSATADNKSFDTGVLAQGKSGTTTFSKAGTFTYYCSVHPMMKGTITVTP